MVDNSLIVWHGTLFKQLHVCMELLLPSKWLELAIKIDPLSYKSCRRLSKWYRVLRVIDITSNIYSSISIDNLKRTISYNTEYLQIPLVVCTDIPTQNTLSNCIFHHIYHYDSILMLGAALLHIYNSETASTYPASALIVWIILLHLLDELNHTTFKSYYIMTKFLI